MKQQPDAALEAFRASLAIAERLVAADPTNSILQRDLSMRLNKTGDALAAQGKLQVALDHYRRSLAIRERLADGDPSSAELQRDVSMSHDRIGNLLAKQGKVEEGIAELQASLKITIRLVAADPANPDWQRDLYASYRNLGLVQERTGNSGEARDMYCRAKSVVVGNSSGGTEWRRRLDWIEQRTRNSC
jgi:tetratricopeptide (TPR) repeat protein